MDSEPGQMLYVLSIGYVAQVNRSRIARTQHLNDYNYYNLMTHNCEQVYLLWLLASIWLQSSGLLGMNRIESFRDMLRHFAYQYIPLPISSPHVQLRWTHFGIRSGFVPIRVGNRCCWRAYQGDVTCDFFTCQRHPTAVLPRRTASSDVPHNVALADLFSRLQILDWLQTASDHKNGQLRN